MKTSLKKRVIGILFVATLLFSASSVAEIERTSIHFVERHGKIVKIVCHTHKRSGLTFCSEQG